MPIYSFEALTPVVDPTTFVHPTAVLIGDVIVGAGCYIGPNASLRGDFGRVVVESGSNIQDNCVMHSFPGIEVLVEQGGHIGHGVILHSCRVGRNALVGMAAVVMDGARIGEGSFVGALSFVKAGFEVPPRMVAFGNPARIVRAVTDEEIAWKTLGTSAYQHMARRSLAGLRECKALHAVEADRPRLPGDSVPLHKQRENWDQMLHRREIGDAGSNPGTKEGE
jgi:phenylacetic acid degradation protein